MIAYLKGKMLFPLFTLSLLSKIEVGSVTSLKELFHWIRFEPSFFLSFFFNSRQGTADKGLPWMADKCFLLYWSSGAFIDFSN